MSTYDIIRARRSIRKFKQDKIDRKLLEKLIEAARLAPSASNLQPLKYVIVDEREKCGQFFKYLRWAAYISPDGNPGKGEEPVAYIVVLADLNVRKSGYELDAGAAVQNICLTATEEGIGSCWIASVDRNAVKEFLNIPDRYDIISIIALGYPDENPVIVDENGSIKYYKDEKGVLHVPKRKLEDIIIS